MPQTKTIYTISFCKNDLLLGGKIEHFIKMPKNVLI